MNPNLKFAERNSIAATIDPVSQGAGTVNTSWVSMGNFNSVCALLGVGVMSAGSTVDAKLQQATDSTGTGAKDIPGKAIVQLLAAGGNNRQALIEVRDTELDVNNGYAFVRLSVTVASAASLVQAVVIGHNPIFVPGSGFNQAGVAQIVG
jgi:hypothetical protein